MANENDTYGEIVRIACGIHPRNEDVRELTADDERFAEEEFHNFFKMSSFTDYRTELATAPRECPFKTKQFGEAAVSVCIDCRHRIVEYENGVTVFS